MEFPAWSLVLIRVVMVLMKRVVAVMVGVMGFAFRGGKFGGEGAGYRTVAVRLVTAVMTRVMLAFIFAYIIATVIVVVVSRTTDEVPFLTVL